MPSYLPPGGAGDPRAGGGRYDTLDRAWISALVRAGNDPQGLGAGRAGGGRDDPDTPRHGRLASCGGRAGTTVFSGPARSGMCETRTGRRGAECISRSAGDGTRNWRAFLRGRAVSAARRVAVSAVNAADNRGGNLFSSGPRRGPPSADEVVGAASRHEPEPLVAAPGQAGRSPPITCRCLRLVHRGL